MQNQQNPDVNSTDVSENYTGQSEREPNNIEDVPGRDVEREQIPVPPDVEDPYPVVDPPLAGDEPLVDVDDSPTRLAGR